MKKPANNLLDLHGVRHEDVQLVLDQFIYHNMKRKSQRVYVITGNSVDMKRIVTKVANEYGFTAVENMFNQSEIIIDL